MLFKLKIIGNLIAIKSIYSELDQKYKILRSFTYLYFNLYSKFNSLTLP